MTKMSVRCEGGRLANQNLNITQCIIQNQNLKISEGFFLNVLQILGARLFHIWLTLGPTRVRFMVGFSPVMAMCSAKSSYERNCDALLTCTFYRERHDQEPQSCENCRHIQ